MQIARISPARSLPTGQRSPSTGIIAVARCRQSMRVACQQKRVEEARASFVPMKIAGALLAAALALSGPAIAEDVDQILDTEIPNVEEAITSAANPEVEETIAEELGAVETEATQVEEDQGKGSPVQDATAGILSQLDALKGALGLQ